MESRILNSSTKNSRKNAHTPVPGFANLSNILQQIVDVVCVIDHKGKFRYVSPASAALWGYEPAEITGHALAEFIYPADLPKTLKALKGDVQFTHHFENRFVRKDGAVVCVSWSANWNRDEQLLYCVAKDGSGQRALEQRLLKAQEIAGVANFEYDVARKLFTYISANIYQICGIERERHGTFSLKLFWSLVHPEDRERLWNELYNHTGKPRKTQHHFRVVRPDSAIVYLNFNRELIYNGEGLHYKSIGTFQDVSAQKISELALLNSEKKFRALVQGGTDLMAIISPEGKYTYIGGNLEQVLGYQPAELEGHYVVEFLHPDFAVQISKFLEKAISQKHTQAGPYLYRNSTGQWRWIESSVTNMLSDPEIKGLVVNSRDVTAQKSANDKLRELSMIAQESLQAILITNTQNQITWANKAFCRITEYTLDEVLGKMPQEVFNARDSAQEQNLNIQEQLYSGKAVQTENLYYSKQGRPYWMHLMVQPMYNEAQEVVSYLAIGKEMTERKQAEEKLQLSEQRFKTLVQGGSDLVVIVDAAGNFSYISESLERTFGYEPDAVLGQNFLAFIHPDDIPETLAGVERVKNNERYSGIRHRFRSKDGSYRWIESVGNNHYDNPLIQGMIVNSRDISDQVILRQALDEELDNKQKEITAAVIKAQESERSILGLELHDNVNQVLTTVKLYNEMYLSGYQEDRSLLERSAKYLQDCINEIRSISKRLSAPTLGKITLQDSISDLVESVNLTNRLQIHYTSSGLNQLFIADDLHLSIYRILQEGLNNIIKYAEATMAKIYIKHKEGQLSLTIEDNGKGFDSSVKSRGIGLTNMKTRAEYMNGSFLLETQPGRGCKIVVRFGL